MPRIGKVFKKRKFYGKLPSNNDESSSIISQPSSSTQDVGSDYQSKSTEKLSNSFSQFDDINCDTQNGYILIDKHLLASAIAQFAACKSCGDQAVTVRDNETARNGLAHQISLQCSTCGYCFDFWTSRKVNNNFEVNVRFAYGMRCIGKGELPGATLCAMLNLPPPVLRFSRINKQIQQVVREVAEESMINATKEAAAYSDETADGIPNIPIAVDGTWQKRGHTSLNGIVTGTSVDTGKVIDLYCMTKYCPFCNVKKDGEAVHHDERCVSNYEGYSGGMECEGSVQIFSRSLRRRGVRYSEYLGDGDTKAFMKVSAAQPYGKEFPIQKLECIGHVQKRLGTRLRKLRKDFKGKRCSDGKYIQGAGRLSDSEVDKLQLYYGLAIRQNNKSVTAMQKAVWAVYLHRISTDECPRHELCPGDEGTWCKYNRAKLRQVSFTHKSPLPQAVLKETVPIFKDLSSAELLRKCLHGRTQNPNESLHNLIWKRAPKTVFVSLTILEIAAYDAVVVFNDGNIGRVKVLQKLGFEPGYNTTIALRFMDEERVRKAEKCQSDLIKLVRQKKRNCKRALEDTNDDMTADYSAGMF